MIKFSEPCTSGVQMIFFSFNAEIAVTYFLSLVKQVFSVNSQTRDKKGMVGYTESQKIAIKKPFKSGLLSVFVISQKIVQQTLGEGTNPAFHFSNLALSEE